MTNAYAFNDEHLSGIAARARFQASDLLQAVQRAGPPARRGRPDRFLGSHTRAAGLILGITIVDTG